MAPDTALCFPETVPTFADTAPLLLLMDGLSHYRATEDSHQPAPPFAGPDLWHSYAPAPLGDKLSPFLRMVADLRGHAGEYYGGFLSTLSPGAASFQEESVRQLISAMVGGQAQDRTAREQEEALWQARLLLQLAENLYFEELEVTENLARVAAKQQEMLHLLRGDDDSDEGEDELPLPALPPPAPRVPIRDSLRCRAWSRLFLADASPRRPAVLATANPDAADLFGEAYAALAGRTPVILCHLPLPALAGLGAAEYLLHREAFRRAATTPLAAIASAMAEALKQGEPGSWDSAAVAAQWEAALADHFPERSTTTRLAISLYPGSSLAALCRQVVRDNGTDKGTALPAHGLIVHLEPSF